MSLLGWLENVAERYLEARAAHDPSVAQGPWWRAIPSPSSADFSPAERATATAVVAMALVADGVVSPAEHGAIRSALKRRGVQLAYVDGLIAAATDGELVSSTPADAVASAIETLDVSHRRVLLRALIHLGRIDSHGAEQTPAAASAVWAVWERAAAASGLSSEEWDTLLTAAGVHRAGAVGGSVTSVAVPR
jgi:uncharacterized tellurite resistance protein B-like protein